MAEAAAMTTAALPYLEQRGEFIDSDHKTRTRLSNRMMKILRIQKIGKQSVTSISHDHIEEPSIVISELACPDPAIELPCRDFVQDDRNISDINREHQQALFVVSPEIELKRIKRTRGERTAGTCEWLLEKGPFRKWYSGAGSQVLRIMGDADMGKTMLMVFLIERLSTTLRVTPGMILTYHFCDNRLKASNTAIAIARVILYQLFQQQPQHYHLLQASYDIHGDALFNDFAQLWSVFDDIIQALGDDNQLLIIIDALDECSAHDRDLLLDCLIGIAQSNKNVRFLFTCRPVEWESWTAQAPRYGLSSLTIDFRDIAGDVKKLVDDKLPKLRAHYHWDDSEDYQVRSSLHNITGTFPVSGIRFLSDAQDNHTGDFVRRLVEHLRIIPPHLDLKRSQSEHPARDLPWNDNQSTHSLPAYTGRPSSMVGCIPRKPVSDNPASEAGEDGLRALEEELRSSAADILDRPATNTSISEPFSIVPTPATSRNPSHTKPSGWQSPVSTVEEGDETNDGEQLTAWFSAYRQPPSENESTVKHEGGAQSPSNSAETVASVKPSPPLSDSGSSHSQSQPLFNPSHPISIFIERARSHVKDLAMLLFFVLALRPFWIYINWTYLVSVTAGLAGFAYLYATHNTSQPASTDYEPPANNPTYSGSTCQSSATFSAFTSSIIRLYGRIIGRRNDGNDDNGASTVPPGPPSDPESGSSLPSECSPDGLSSWVLTCLIAFILLGGFAAIAQTIACVRVHDESLLSSYILPTRDDTDHWELLSNSAFVVCNIFIQSGVSFGHVRADKDKAGWIILFVFYAMCLATVPISLQLYLDRKYVSKAATGFGNLIGVGVTFFTILKLEQIAQKKTWTQAQEAERKEISGLRSENLRLRTALGPLSPPETPPRSDF